MKEIISPFQLLFLVFNFLLTGTLITAPAMMTQVSKQYTWLVPILVCPLILLMIVLIFKGKKSLTKVFTTNQLSRTKNLFHLVLGIFIVVVYIKDLRALVDFIAGYLLPNTPIPVIVLFLSLTLIYISSAGLEVIARITLIQMITLAVTIILIPLLLINEFEITYLFPVVTEGTIANLSRSSFLMFPWMGEIVIFLLLLGNISTEKGVKGSFILGTCLALLFLFLLIITSIAVLGDYIMSQATYPNMFMIQEINLTDFLDRLDLIIVILWMPCCISKLALSLYCLFRILINLKVTKSNLLFTPVGLLLGILSILLFTTNIVHLEFTFYTWTIMAIILEMLIVVLFMVIKYKTKITQEKNA
jgi:spore germination protein